MLGWTIDNLPNKKILESKKIKIKTKQLPTISFEKKTSELPGEDMRLIKIYKVGTSQKFFI